MSALEMLKSGSVQRFSLKFVKLMEDALHEATDGDQLVQTFSTLVTTFVGTYGCHTFPDKQLNKTFVTKLVQAFKEKITELAKDDKEAEAQLLKSIID